MTRPFAGPAARRRVLRFLKARDRSLLVALDLDGTLAPIAPRPEMAGVPGPTLRALRGAVRARGVRVAVLSARPLRDMRRMVPIDGIHLIGQYGLDGALAPPVRERRRHRRGCARVTRALRPIARRIPGVLVEPKGLTVAVHDREVRARLTPELRRALQSVERGTAAREGFTTVRGRDVVDFVPRGFDKGRALTALRSRLRPHIVFYFGDSPGDEAAFAILDRRDFPIRVGSGTTRARYRVRGLAQVTRFLSTVAALRADSA